MVLQQIPRRVVQLGYGNLEINLGLNDIQLCLGELSLGIENKKDRLGAQFVFSFVRMKVFPRQGHSDFGCFHGEFGLFECVHCIRNLQRNALIRLTFLILVAPPADKRIGQIGLCGVISHREGQRKRGAVGWIRELEDLAQAAA